MGSHGAKENLAGIGSMVRPNSARLSHAASASQLRPPVQQSLRHSTGSLKAALANPFTSNVVKVFCLTDAACWVLRPCQKSIALNAVDTCQDVARLNSQ